MRTAACASILICAWAPGLCLARPAAEEHVRDLRSGAPCVRENAAISLGRIRDRASVPALAEALGDKESRVRLEAAKALGFIKDPRAVPALLKALGDGDRNVRFYAAYALGEIGDPKAAAALLQALGDPAWCVRDQAAWALRGLGDPKLAGPLAAALKEESADVAHIMWLLRHLGGKQAVGPLATLLRDPDARVRKRAVRALGELGDKGAVEPLIAALVDKSSEVRRLAVEALVALGDERAEEPLKALAARETDPSVRAAARKATLAMLLRGDLAAWWSFDDRDTRVAKDMTGRGTDGEIKGCTVVKGKVGHALRFGEGRYVELGKPAALSIAQRPFTVMAWAKTDAKQGVVVARGGAFCGYSLYIKDGVAKFGIHREQDGPAHIAAGTEQVAGAWVHLAGVVKEKRIEVYVNGKLAGAAKTPGYIPGNCGQGMEIGFDAANSPAEITDAFEGIIDEVKVFDAALSQAEIAKQARTDKETTTEKQ